VNLTWQTITGLTQRHRFISEAVRPWSQRLRPTAGRLKNGHSSTPSESADLCQQRFVDESEQATNHHGDTIVVLVTTFDVA
jgi:hypothetical protein